MGLEAKKISPRTILPVATIDKSQRLIFDTVEDQDIAWQIGVFT